MDIVIISFILLYVVDFASGVFVRLLCDYKYLYCKGQCADCHNWKCKFYELNKLNLSEIRNTKYMVEADVFNAIHNDLETSLLCYEDEASRSIVQFCYDSMMWELSRISCYRLENVEKIN